MNNFDLLINAFKNISFYVMGAGASANIVPMTYQLREPIIKEHKLLGAYSALSMPRDELTQRIIGDVSESDFYLNRISPDFTTVCTYHQLARHHWEELKICYEYDVFHFAKSPSTIFTANLDALADRHGHKHNVYHFHGKIPKFFGSHEYWEELRDDYFAFYDNYRVNKKGIFLIEKESETIWERDEYILAEQQFLKARFLVIIGYSFGKNDFGMDDQYTFNFLFRKLYPKNKVPVVVISPDTYDLKNLIQDTVKSKEVYGLDMRWNCLSRRLIDYFMVNCGGKFSDFEMVIEM